MPDFALLPPEINSARMYAGPGAGPMLAAASAWEGLAAQLAATATSGAAVVAALAAGWTGPSAASMTAAAQRTISWLHVSVAEAEQTAAQQRAAAAAYEAAFTATVPPPAIAANRSLQTSLIATNFLGQNAPAIAALEAQYMEMWAQDAAAMLGYDAAATAAAQLVPFSDPPQATSAASAAASDPAPDASSGLSLLSGLTGPFSPLSLLSPALGGYLFGTEFYALPSVSANVADLTEKVAALPPATAGIETRPAAPTAAGIGRAGLVGRLSVPPTWSSTAPAMKFAPAAASPATATPTTPMGLTSPVVGGGGLARDLAFAGATGSRRGKQTRTSSDATIFVIRSADWPSRREA
ncbi:PPE family protein [[Mycobacterium] vasticus]|uniref:PPE family protein n=1 Tax=[Mycobacterium] vasticus TaxID=2875777 RepID=A0ABU5Z2Y2_9MYCO|nr:PPE family protein [Mycolicibacter sp. MYC017]MEB3071751.1 PPE family protein [Mycolicibacter sp. MYC017]